MKAGKAINIEDLFRLTKRRLPKIAFDFMDGGCEDEELLGRNKSSFARYRLNPRYLVDVSKRDQSVQLFGRTYARPFGIAPTGMVALCRPGGDLMLAEAAKRANIPFIQSGASTASIEDVAKVAPDHAWYQLYQPKDQAIADDLVRRARDAGMSTFVLTVDSQGGSNLERNTRNGFGQPLKMSLRTKLEAATHIGWMMDYLRHGTPIFESWRPYAGADADPAAIAKLVTSQGRAVQTWRDVEHFRRLWPGNLVLKGIMHPDDAMRAVECGADGVIVSNHGGRKLDRSPASIEVFPAIHAVVGDKTTLMFDSGIRRGADIITALCLGAKYCFVGRATLYGVAAGGLAGATRAISILGNEMDLVMQQIGCATIPTLGRHCLLAEGEMR